MPINNEKGLSLTEILIALALTGMVVVMSYKFLSDTKTITKNRTLEAQSANLLEFISKRLSKDLIYKVDDQAFCEGPCSNFSFTMPLDLWV